MITPILVQAVFWIGSAASIIAGLIAIGSDNAGSGILFIIFGPFMIRIYCELLILFFRMNETLTDISNSVGGSASRPSSTVPAPSQQPSWQPSAD